MEKKKYFNVEIQVTTLCQEDIVRTSNDENELPILWVGGV